jgi:hypothetical protein
MKKKHTAQLRHHVASTRKISVSAFFHLRALLALVVCSAAACSMLSGALLAFFRSEAPMKASHPAAAGLTFADRVAYQRAIEEVYWRHRIWPKENSKPKPSLDEVMSAQQIEKKVEDYLRKSQALENKWREPITADQLQAEMDRMAKHTRQAEVLRELFDALGRDPFVIAECLARPALAESLLTDINAYDPRIGAELKQPVQADMPLPDVTTIRNVSYTLSEMSDAPNECPDAWAATSTTNAPSSRYVHTAVWTGSEMIVWGGENENFLYFNTGGKYTPSTDTWATTSTNNAPIGRAYHTAIWTGSEMIVWGGYGGGLDDLNTGGKYNPNTDTWTPVSVNSAPTGRSFHTAVWTGSEMIAWGGYHSNGGLVFNTGGRYNPGSNSWTATPTTNAPTPRFSHTAIWTGGEMIVWGGEDVSSAFNTGGRYNPGTNDWTATSTTNAPSARLHHTAIWTGDEIIVWGGDNFPNFFNTGGRYSPNTDTWIVTTGNNAPSSRYSHTAVWTGSEMIVWGGFDGSGLNTGGRYNAGMDSWTATSTANAPTGRESPSGVWIGDEMIVWGGDDAINTFNTGGRYCAQFASPTPRPTATPRPRPSPAPRP